MRFTDISESEIHPEHQLPFLPHAPRRVRLLRYARYVRRHFPTSKDWETSLRTAFSRAAHAVPSIEIHRGVLGGTPCVKGTRIPVYMVLDAIEFSGTLKGALKSYPQLRLEQVKDAIRFAKLVSESPLDDEASFAS